ncbi:hypothetical protein D3C72_667470 [compost metagenome]
MLSTPMPAVLSAAICAVVSDAMVCVDRPGIAFELSAAMSLVENVAISSAPRAATCVELSAPTWAPVKAST